MTRLRKIVCDPALMEDLCRAAFSGQGRFLTGIVGAWRELFLARVQRDGLRACPVPQAHGLTAAAFRDFLGADGKQCVELLYGGEDFLGVRRYLPSKRRHNPHIPTRLQLGSIYTIKASSDGRYVALGSTRGGVEVWNLDMDEPALVFDGWLNSMGNIVALSFSASNCALYVSGSQGGIVQLRVLGEGAARLHRDPAEDDGACGWNCFAIDTQSEGDGVAFAGDGNKVWLLNVENAPVAALSDDVPFPYGRGKTVTGGNYFYLPGLHRARLGCLETFSGGLIQHLHFLDRERLAVAGEKGVEVFHLPTGKRILRQPHSKDVRIPALGALVDSGRQVETVLVLASR